MDNISFKNTISVSQIGAFNDCQYKWSLMYKENIRTKRGDISPSSVGSVVHEGMAAALRAHAGLQNYNYKPETKLRKVLSAANSAIDRWSVDNFSENKSLPTLGDDEGSIVMIPDEGYAISWQEMVANAKLIVERTIANLDLIKRYTVVRWEGQPLIEHKIEVDLSLDLGFPSGTYGFVGVIDAVMFDKHTGATVVFDWKLHKRFTNLEDEQLSSQIALYQHALRLKYGITAQLGIVYQIKQAPPRKPTLNKDGSMSRRQITSDWPTYEAALIEAGLNPDDYIVEMRPKLSESEFYRPLMVFRTPEISQIFWDNLLTFANTIIKQQKHPMALGFSCRRCIFAALCNARIYGLDTEALFEDRYEIISKDVVQAEEIDDEALEENIG